MHVPPITAGSAKVPDWSIREAVKPWKIIRGTIKNELVQTCLIGIALTDARASLMSCDR